MPNFAFIDGQNLHLGTAELGWSLNRRRFRTYLEEHYRVSHTYYFIGYIPDHRRLYTELRTAGYILVFKEVTYRGHGTKGQRGR